MVLSALLYKKDEQIQNEDAESQSQRGEIYTIFTKKDMNLVLIINKTYDRNIEDYLINKKDTIDLSRIV